MEIFLYSIRTGMKFIIIKLSDGNISLLDWYWYELYNNLAFRWKYFYIALGLV